MPAASRFADRRLLVSLCIAGALAFACGPRTHTDASTALLTVFRHSKTPGAPIADVTRPSRRGATEDSHEQTLAGQLDANIDRRDILLTLNATNGTKKRIEVNFANGQTYEFVVLDSLGREVWRWSNRRLFTQTMQNKLLDGGQSIRVAERWRAPAAGHYQAIATLRSSNYPVEQRIEFDAK